MQFRNGVAEMSISKIKKPDSLIKAEDKVAKLCPFNPDLNTDEGKKMDMDSAIAELKSAFREYADIIEREVIKLTRIYQADYEEMWQKVIEENEVFNINLDSLMNKNRHLEDKLHGFIAKRADTIFQYSYISFKDVFNSYTRFDNNRGYTERFIGNYKNGYEYMKSELEKYVDNNINIGILQMRKYVSDALLRHNKSIINKFIAVNDISDELIINKKSEQKTLKGSSDCKKSINRYLRTYCYYCNTIETIAKDIMENGFNGNYTGSKKRVRRNHKRN